MGYNCFNYNAIFACLFHFKRNIFFRCNAFHVDDGITHPAQSRVYANAQFFCDFLKAHVLIESHEHNLALGFGQHLVQNDYV